MFKFLKKVQFNTAQQPVTKPTNYQMSGDPLIQVSFTGEITPDEVSPTKDYIPDYVRLSGKSWQLYYESELAQIVINNDINWVCGTGLNLKIEPKTKVLTNLGVDPIPDDFTRDFEELFKVYKKSNMSSWSTTMTLDKLSRVSRLTKIVGGDVLHVYRYSGKQRVSLQAIDGRNVVSPTRSIDLNNIKSRGNRVIHGVEINSTGRHVAYWVKTLKNQTNDTRNTEAFSFDKYEIKRILATGPKSKRVLAKLCYGSQYRIDEVRGMPLLSALLESANVLQRYKDAAVGSAEERQNIPYAIQHGEKSTGENPLEEAIATAEGLGIPNAAETVPVGGYAVTDGFARRVASTTKKTVINMPIDSQIKAIESKSELYYKDFVITNFGFFCATLGQPPEVALLAFNSNFSASRMAGKMWEYNVDIKRNQEGDDLYRPFSSMLLEVAVNTNMIPYSKIYHQAKSAGWVAMEALEYSRFTGVPIPHVDPVKEVAAERLKLGDAFKDMPLTTPQASAERLNLGELATNMPEFKKVYEEMSYILERQSKAKRDEMVLDTEVSE